MNSLLNLKRGKAPSQPASFRGRWMSLLALACLLTLIVISCSTVDRLVVAPPQIPGAKFIGSKNCEECHSEITRDFKTATHARLQAKGPNAADMGCESCHGPGSLHSDSGGGRQTIINPPKSPNVCFECHLDKRGQFNLPHHHPLETGKVTCVDCHNPHRGPVVIGGGTSLATENETCFKCHTMQRGPFVFEHEATREGCTTCHEPHGSVNAKMLMARDAHLCLKCHFQPQVASNTLGIGGRSHTSRLRGGTCWTAGCHEAVHGSQIGSSLRY